MDTILFDAEPDFKSKVFKAAFAALKEADIEGDKEIRAVITIYTKTKDVATRNACLKLLYNKNSAVLKTFFADAYKKERSLDMKLYALRGLAQFVAEDEIAERLVKFNETLKERAHTAPYNYQEYEFLLGQNAFPYLLKKYGYGCLKESLEILQNQYNAMPDAFKGHFTIDENGQTVFLRRPEESTKMMADFFRSG
ncbi:MAG: hypothetical protein Ta2A_13680 [Treponemataceae bacterium]|nr:MAG: hypothetical protein Ta2A_13680 [Treponemataceae bacterium]